MTSIDENKKEEDSVVYINRYYEVQIFETTPELIAFLQSRSRLVVVDTISDPSFITGLVFLILIAVVFYVGLRDDHFNREALSALTSVLGVAAGFYFGTKRQA